MITLTIEQAQQIEEALVATTLDKDYWLEKCMDSLDNIREARAEQEKQEPVAYFLDVKAGFSSKPLYEQVSDEYKNDADVFPLYAAPQPVQSLSAQDLNDLEIETKWAGDSHEFERIVNAAVAKLKPVRTKDLTVSEIQEVWNKETNLKITTREIDFARAVIAAYKEKNNVK